MFAKTATYPWYSEVSAREALQQGDLILKCQIVQPSAEAYAENQTLSADIAEYDVIVMSQSCDLLLEKVELVLVCPFYSLTDLGNLSSGYRSADMKEKLRQGYVVGFHLLDKVKLNGVEDYLVVDFKSVYAIPLKLLKQIVLSRGNHSRLLPPYREHLSQAFARFFMRVGLPVDIPPFK